MLGREDSNLRIAAPKAAALPLGYAPILFGVTPKTLFNDLRRPDTRTFECPAKSRTAGSRYAATG